MKAYSKACHVHNLLRFQFIQLPVFMLFNFQLKNVQPSSYDAESVFSFEMPVSNEELELVKIESMKKMDGVWILKN